MRFISSATERMKGGDDDAETTLELTSAILEICDAEGLVTPKAEFLMLAAVAADELGNFEWAHRYAEESVRYWKILTGDDSEQTKSAEHLAFELKRRPPME
jgi:HEPN domain-containing protein